MVDDDQRNRLRNWTRKVVGPKRSVGGVRRETGVRGTASGGTTKTHTPKLPRPPRLPEPPEPPSFLKTEEGPSTPSGSGQQGGGGRAEERETGIDDVLVADATEGGSCPRAEEERDKERLRRD